jgi:hypothetical protein
VVRARSWRNVPVDLGVLLLFLLFLPALLAVDLAVFAVAFVFHVIWEFHVVRSGYLWLRDKERLMWEGRRRQLRRAFLSEEPGLLQAGSAPASQAE